MRRLLPLLLVVAACASDDPPRVISAQLIPDTIDAHGPYEVVSVIMDDRRVSGADLLYVGGSTVALDPVGATTSTMTSEDRSTWTGRIPAFPLHTVVTWWVDARDHRDQRTLDGPHSFVVGNVPSIPEILTLFPTRGPSSGETEVLIVGRDFRAGMVVFFDRGQAETVELISRTQIRVKTPPGPVGLVDVMVRNEDGGEATRVNGFEYLPVPEIEQIIPPRGPVAGGTFVRILGRRFQPDINFLFDGLSATNVTVLSVTEATALTPPHEAGFVDVAVTHPEAGTSVRPGAYEYVPPPIVLAIDPNRGPDLGGTPVLVTGDNFEAGAQLFFDGISAVNTVVVTGTRISAVTPPHAIGFSDVQVVNPDQQSGVLENGFFFFGPPEIDAVIPPYAAADGGAVVTVRGANFVEETVVTIRSGNLQLELDCTLIDDATLSCVVFSTLPEVYDVTVTNPDARFDTLPNGLTTFQILAVDPIEGPASGGNPVRITGENFPVAAGVFFGGSQAACNWVNPSRIDCLAPPGPGDTFVDVDVLPPDQGQVPSRLVDGYYYVPPPEVLSTVPDFGPLRGGQTILIVGRFFQPGATVTLDGLPCTNVIFLSSEQLQCVVPANAPGLAEVRVTNPDNQTGARDAYEYVPITFTPEWGLVDGFANMDIRGAGFASNAVVTIGGSPAVAVQFISSERMRARAPPRGNTGPAEVRVTNPGETPEISPDTFSYRVYRNETLPSMAGTGETSDVMVVDLDNDGDNDMVYLNGGIDSPSESQTLQNQGGGLGWTTRNLGFSEVSNEGDHCDFNEDGLEDLVWGVSGGSIRVYRNQGGFTFASQTPPTQPADSFEASFHDVAGDARCDLINLAISEADTVLRNDNGAWVAIPNPMPHDPGFIHDHKLDSGDLDGDGDNDLIVVVDNQNFPSATQRGRVYLNDGNGQFTEDMRNRAVMEAIFGDVYDVRIEDIDRDGDLDAVMPNFNNEPVILLNSGNGVLTRALNRIPNVARADSAVIVTDIEGDGDVDIYLVTLQDGPGGSSGLFLNDGAGFFFRAAVGEPQNPPGAYRAAAGDINGDDRTDLVLGIVFGPNRMYWALE